MEKPGYCTRENVDGCYVCSLTNYKKDCMNNPVQYPEYPDDEPVHNGSDN